MMTAGRGAEKLTNKRELIYILLWTGLQGGLLIREGIIGMI